MKEGSPSLFKKTIPLSFVRRGDRGEVHQVTMLKQRIITSLWGIPLISVAVWFDRPLPWFTILIAAWGVLAVREFYKVVAASKVSPLTYFGMALTLLFILSRDSGLPALFR